MCKKIGSAEQCIRVITILILALRVVMSDIYDFNSDTRHIKFDGVRCMEQNWKTLRQCAIFEAYYFAGLLYRTCRCRFC